jgi:primosomal protein N' (replication factor Y)
MNQINKIIKVAVLSPLDSLFDYRPENGKKIEDYPIGSRVNVPFGSTKKIGIVISYSEKSKLNFEKLKPINSLIDKDPIVGKDFIKLATWISEYYIHPFGDTLFNMLPNILRKGGSYNPYVMNMWKTNKKGQDLPLNTISKTPKQKRLLELLREKKSNLKEISELDILKQGFSKEIIKKLFHKNLIEKYEKFYIPEKSQSLIDGKSENSNLKLTHEQKLSIDTIYNKLSSFEVILLDGITGSGKTEIYFQVINKVLASMKQVLVLIPEISLTPQTIQRFTKRFSKKIAIFHSKLSEKERLLAWRACKEEEAEIIIGTRSSIFTPLPNIGLIIIDEEHDSSYKQNDGLHYSARDIGIVKAKNQNIPIILGTATPSLESFHNAQKNKYTHTKLKQRAGNAKLPNIQILDIRNKVLDNGFSEEAIHLIKNTLKSGKQVLVFINRRGYAPLLMCHDCGWNALCPQCDARLTVHRKQEALRCHHCNFSSRIPEKCNSCESKNLVFIGQGTQRNTETLQNLFPHFPVIRIDRDSIQNKKSFEKYIKKINSGDPLILVGTQMLAKGHHFPLLSTIVILDIDQGIYNPDFRSEEKVTQLLTQVSGRAGRAEHEGNVLIQTYVPDNDILSSWKKGGYHGSIVEILKNREFHELPPFTHMGVIRADSTKPDEAFRFLKSLIDNNRNDCSQNCQIIGPIPLIMEKRAGRHRAQIIFKSKKRFDLNKTINNFKTLINSNKKNYRLRFSIDIDPSEVA